MRLFLLHVVLTTTLVGDTEVCLTPNSVLILLSPFSTYCISVLSFLSTQFFFAVLWISINHTYLAYHIYRVFLFVLEINIKELKIV